MKSDTEIYALLADADPVVAPLDTSALTLRIESALGHGLAAPVTEPTRKETSMVTHQEPDIEMPTTPPPRQRSRGPLFAIAAAALVIVVGIGIAYTAGAFESETDVAAQQLAVATDLVDTWHRGWNESDPDIVMSMFTDDAIYIEGPLDEDELEGSNVYTMARMPSYVAARDQLITNAHSVGELTPSGDNTYTVMVEFESGGNRFGGELEIELEGDLVARMEWTDGYHEIGPVSDS